MKVFRIKKINNLTKKDKIKIILIASFTTVVIISLFLLINGHNPLSIFINIIFGSIGSKTRIVSTLKFSIPLITTALALSVAFKMKLWNIGGEGQIIMGAVFATYFALNFVDVPRFLLLTIMLIASFVGGALWALIPALLKTRFNTNETIVTLMLNYVALSFVTYLQFQAWTETSGFPKIPLFVKNAQLPEFFRLHIGWIFTIIIGIIVYYFVYKSKKGFEVSVIGESINTAKYAGINIKLNTILVMIISGGLCGIVGFIEASGNVNTLTVDITRGVGYTAIIIAWLANLNPKRVFIVGLLFAVMTQGGHFIKISHNVHYNTVGVMQAIILFCALASNFFMSYKIVMNRKGQV